MREHVRRRVRAPAAFGGLLLLVLGVACTADKPVEVSGIQLGRSRNSDKTIGEPTLEFGPGDRMQAAVLLTGRGSGVKVKARWSMPGGLASDSEQTVSPRDGAVVPFELQSAGGFPPGNYKLEVWLNGTSVGVKEFRVRS